MMTSWSGDLSSTGARCSHVVRRLRWGYRSAHRARSSREVKDGTERGGALSRIPGDNSRRAADLVTRREGRAEAGTDLSREPGLRTAWCAHADELYGFARRNLGDAAAAEDALQETFVRAWRSADRYDPTRPLRPWLFAILRNVVVDEARSRGLRPVPQDWRPREVAGEPEDTLDRAMDAWMVEEALRRIKPDHRAVLVETYYRGQSYADVAARMGIPEGTARSRAFYGLRSLRLALDEMGWEG